MARKSKPASAGKKRISPMLKNAVLKGKQVKKKAMAEEQPEEKEQPSDQSEENKKEKGAQSDTNTLGKRSKVAPKSAGEGGKKKAEKKHRFFSFGHGKKNKEQGEEKEEEAEESKERPFVIEVREKKKKSSVAVFFQTLNYLGMGRYRHLFVQTLATMLNAGLPLLDSLRAFEAEVRSKAVKKMVGKVIVSVENGSSFWRAMEDTCFFSPYEIALVHIGEDAGNLARNMEYLSDQQEKDHALKQKVKMAMIYPTIVLTMMFVIVMGLGMFVLPNLVQVLYSLDVDLPLATRIVIEVSKFFEVYGMKVVPLMILFFIFLALLSRFTRFKAVTQWFMFRIPGIGSLAKEATIARFGVIMGGLLRAGVPLVEALESLADVTQVYSYKSFYTKLLARINVGDSFAKAFEMMPHTRKLLPVSVQQLVVTGERSGTLSATLLKIADIYEKKAEETAEKLPIILEPMLLLFIGALVGTIAFAIIVPIYSVVGNVGRS
ncbi:MAG TPA: type II secretion system F family protein [Candidatus Peribacteraceae bacterium]|nr:type II secretion system F family protein [Candidatus Peribacteraceae bacterium]